MPNLADSTAIYIGTQAASAVYVGTTKVWPTAPVVRYLAPSVGHATTPDTTDMNLGSSQWVLTVKAQGPGTAQGATPCAVVLQGRTGVDTGQIGWNVRRQGSAVGSGTNIVAAYSGNGSTSTGPGSIVTTQNQTGTPQCYGFTTRVATGTRYTKVLTSADDGATWTPGTETAGGPATMWDSTAPLYIGASFTSAAPTQVLERIYWCELRTGADPKSGTVIWRFDASEYPGAGTSYVDPRGRTWTLTNASAIVTP